MTQIARALNSVRTAGQARGAVGAALVAIGNTYPALEQLNKELARSGRSELDGARVALEQWYKKIQAPPEFTYQNEWRKHRRLVDRAYVAVAGVEGAAGYEPQTSNLDILLRSIVEAPKVFAEGVGTVTKTVANTAGSAASGLLNGLLGGLGPFWVIIAVIIVVGIVRGGGPLGAVAGILGRKA